MSIQFEKKHADKDSTNASQQSSFFFPSEDKRNLMHFREREQRFEARSVIAGELTPNIQEVERRSRKEEASGSARRAVLRSCQKAPSGKIDRTRTALGSDSFSHQRRPHRKLSLLTVTVWNEAWSIAAASATVSFRGFTPFTGGSPTASRAASRALRTWSSGWQHGPNAGTCA